MKVWFQNRRQYASIHCSFAFKLNGNCSFSFSIWIELNWLWFIFHHNKDYHHHKYDSLKYFQGKVVRKNARETLLRSVQQLQNQWKTLDSFHFANSLNNPIPIHKILKIISSSFSLTHSVPITLVLLSIIYFIKISTISLIDSCKFVFFNFKRFWFKRKINISYIHSNFYMQWWTSRRVTL